MRLARSGGALTTAILAAVLLAPATAYTGPGIALRCVEPHPSGWCRYAGRIEAGHGGGRVRAWLRTVGGETSRQAGFGCVEGAPVIVWKAPPGAMRAGTADLAFEGGGAVLRTVVRHLPGLGAALGPVRNPQRQAFAALAALAADPKASARIGSRTWPFAVDPRIARWMATYTCPRPAGAKRSS